MADRKDTNMDAEVRLELAEFKNEIHTTIIDSISNGFKEVEKHLTDLFNKDIEHVKQTQERFASHHNEHFQNDKEVRRELNSLKDTIHGEISKIKEMVIEETVTGKTKDAIDEKTDRKKGVSAGYVVILVSIASVVTAIIAMMLQ